MAGYRGADTELSLVIDDELRRALDAICELSGGVLDRSSALLAAAQRGLPSLMQEADVHAARTVRRCPRCGEVGLAPREQDGVLLQSCVECGGIWLDNASLRRVFEAPTPEVMDLARRVDHNARSIHDITPELVCPVCEAKLVRRQEANSSVRLDTCARHGTWFDKSELTRFARVVAAKRQALAELEEAARRTGLSQIGAWVRQPSKR